MTALAETTPAKNADSLDLIRASVQRNMPRPMVRTKRQPMPDSLMEAVSALGDNDDAIEFLESEDDASAAVALASLYKCAVSKNSDEYVRIRLEIDSFKRRLRSIYLAELGNALGDGDYDNIIDEKIFRERVFRYRDPDATLIVRYCESIDTLMDEELPNGGDKASAEKIKKTGQWFQITYKKLIERCEACLKDKKNLSEDDLYMIRFILERSKKERDIITKIIDAYQKDPAKFGGRIWAEAVEMVR